MPLDPLQSALLATAPRPKKNTQGFNPSTVPALTDTDSVKGQITPADLKERIDPLDVVPDGSPTLTTAQARELVGEVKSRLRQAQMRKSERCGEFFESRSLFNGDMWRVWHKSTARWRDMRPQGWQKIGRRFEQFNIVRKSVLENVARVTRNEPEIGIRPESDRPQDVQAAHEARQALDTIRQDQNREAFIRAAVQEMCLEPPLVKAAFDPSAYDTIMVRGKAEQAQVGKVVNELVPWSQWFAPAGNVVDAKGVVCPQWIIHHRPVKVSDLQGYYKNAYAVEPEPGVNGETNQMARASDNDVSRDGGMDTTAEWAMLSEQYEPPTPALKELGYKDGRVTTVAGNVLLDVRNMDDGVPFYPLYCTRVENDANGHNYVGSLISPQRAINRLLSKMLEYSDLPEFWVWTMAQTTVSPDAYTGPEITDVGLKVNRYMGGAPPTIQTKPQTTGASLELFNLIQQLYTLISGITPAGDMGSMDASGAAITARMESDQSVTKDQLGNLFAMLLWLDDRCAQLVAKYYDTPRMMSLSSEDNPQDAAMGVVAMRALCGGGKVRLKLNPDSLTPRTPAIQMQFLTQIMQPGNLNPETLPATIAYLKAVDVYGTDEIASHLEAALQQVQQQAQQNQPDPAALQAQQAQQQQALQEAQQAHLQAMAEASQAHEAQILAAQEQIQQAKQAADERIAQTKAALDLHAAETLAAQKHQHQLEILTFERAHPSFTLAGKMDPAAVEAAEKEAGLVGDMASIAESAPKPAPVTGKPAPKGKPAT